MNIERSEINMKLRKKTAAAMLMAFFCVTLASGCGQTKIGYIDGERVSKEAPQINSLIEEGNQKIEEAQAQAGEELQKKLQENPDMSQEELQKAQMERNAVPTRKVLRVCPFDIIVAFLSLLEIREISFPFLFRHTFRDAFILPVIFPVILYRLELLFFL